VSTEVPIGFCSRIGNAVCPSTASVGLAPFWNADGTRTLTEYPAVLVKLPGVVVATVYAVEGGPLAVATPVKAIGVPPLAAEITPADAVIVVPSTLHAPNVELLHCGIAGAPSDRMNVVALPFTAAVPIVAVGLAPAGSAPPSTIPVVDVLLKVATCPTVDEPDPVTLPPPDGVAHAGSPPDTPRNCPDDPTPKRVNAPPEAR
jgi:hypothetical protein